MKQLTAYLQLGLILMQGLFSRRQIKLGQSEAATDVVAAVRVEEQRHALGAQVPVPVLFAVQRVDLGVRVEVPHTLDVHHDQLVPRTLKREVAESLQPE